MKTVINIKVYDPTWLERPSEEIEYFKSIKEPEDIDAMKYQEGISFDFGFDILDYTVSKNSSHKIILQQDNNLTEATIPNVLVIAFRGEREIREVIISSELIFGNFDAQKSGGKQYFYIYLNGNLDYQIVSENIWLSRGDYTDLFDRFPNTTVYN
ncbi:MAG: hypothetical protein EOO43_06065, partial [Flavobacterium sp.]